MSHVGRGRPLLENREKWRTPWELSFYDRRVRDGKEYFAFREYIRQNPQKRRLVVRAQDYRYGSAWPGLVLDEVPQPLKPADFMTA